MPPPVCRWGSQSKPKVEWRWLTIVKQEVVVMQQGDAWVKHPQLHHYGCEWTMVTGTTFMERERWNRWQKNKRAFIHIQELLKGWLQEQQDILKGFQAELLYKDGSNWHETMDLLTKTLMPWKPCHDHDWYQAIAALTWPALVQYGGYGSSDEGGE